MPSWKKLIQSGSNAELSQITASKGLIVDNQDGGDVKFTIANSNADNGMDKSAGIYFKHAYNGNTADLRDAGKITAGKHNLYYANPITTISNLRFFTGGGSSGDEQRLIMYGTGPSTTRVGIGFSESDTSLPTIGLSVVGNISASGNITTTGIIYASQFLSSSVAGNLPVDGYLKVGGYIWASGSNSHITASGNISSSGNIYSTGFYKNGVEITGGGGGGIFNPTGSKQATTNTIEITGSLKISGSSTLTNIGQFTNTGDAIVSGDLRAGDFVEIKPIGKKVSISGSLTVSGSNTFAVEGPSQFTGSVEITNTNDAAFRFKAGDFFEIKKSPLKQVTISGSLKVSGSNTFEVEGPTQLTGSFSVNDGTTDVIIDDTGFILSGSKLRVTGSVESTGNIISDLSIIAATSSFAISKAEKFLPKDATADIGNATKRISNLYMSSNIDFDSGSNNILQFSGGNSGRVRYLTPNVLFTTNAAALTDTETVNALSPYIHINPVRMSPRIPILRIGQANRPVFDVSMHGSIDYINGGGGHDLIPSPANSSGGTSVDRFGQVVKNANVVIRDYTFSSPPSGGYWIDFQTVSSGSGGITSGSMGVIGMHAGKPTFALGTNSPSASLHISSSISGSSFTDLIRVQNDIGVPIFKVKPDRIILRNSGSSAFEATMSVDSSNNLVINDNLLINHTDIRLKSPDGNKEVKLAVSNDGDLTFKDSNDAKIMDMKEGGKIDVGGTAATSQSLTNWQGAISASGYVKCKNTFIGHNYGFPDNMIIAHSDRVSSEASSLAAGVGFALGQASTGYTYVNAGNGSIGGYKSINFYQAGVPSMLLANNRNLYIGTNQSSVNFAPPEKLTVQGNISASGDLNLTNITSSGDVNISGVLTATRKSFVIPHPTDEGKQLQYASLEGPENGVYIRGKLEGDDVIELPHYWSELINEETISVSLTPIRRFQYLYVKDISSKEIMIGTDKEAKRKIYCHYVVYAERKDIDKLEVEI